MTSPAAVAVSGSARGESFGAAGDGGPGGLSKLPGLPSRLDGLKRERAQLSSHLERMQAARAELEAPGIELQNLAVEAEQFERETAAALAAWARGGCEGHRPVPNAALAGSLARRHEAATAAANANGVAIIELAGQADAIRARLEAIDAEITAEAVAVLTGGLDAEMAAIGAAADELNQALGRALGLRAFALSHLGNHAFARLAEQISQLRTPEIGGTRAQIEATAAEWAQRFEELME